MNKEEIRAFKNELKNVNFYRNKINELKIEIEIIEYDLTGVKAVNFTPHQSTTNPISKSSYYYAQLDKKDKLIKKKKAYDDKLNSINQLLDSIDDGKTKQMIIDIYIEGKGFLSTAIKFNYSNHGVQQRIDSALKKIEL